MNELPGFFQSVLNVWRDVVLALGISAISGAVSHLHAMRKRKPVTFSLIGFCLDVGTSALVGFFALMLCLEHHVSPWMTGPIVGIASHAATRILFLGDFWVASRVKQLTGATDDDDQA